MSEMDSKFLWGAATSSHQIEGGNDKNDWWQWEQEGKIEGGAKSGPATDHRHRWEEDLDLAKEMGLNAYRFSIEWSRIEPSEGVWNESELNWYLQIVEGCEKRNLKPMVTLHHFSIPLWFANDGGFSNVRAPEVFLRYVSKVLSVIGDRIPLWCTINEPMVYVIGAYLGKFMPPGRYEPLQASLACANLLRCHVRTYDLIHKEFPHVLKGPHKGEAVQVGYAHNMIRFKPERRLHVLENLIAKRVDLLYNMAWIEATMGLDQKFSLPWILPKVPLVKEALKNPRCDFIGVNFYTRVLIQWRPRAQDENQLESIPVGASFAKRGELSSDLGWSISPKSFGVLLARLAKFKKPIYITENGIADRDDSRRPRYLLTHLLELAKSGLDIRGYFHWSLIDNFEWIKGFGPRFGLYTVDYNTFKRTPTKTAKLYREIIEAHEKTKPPQTEWLEEALKDFDKKAT